MSTQIKNMQPGETEETYMLYKLLAYAIQELSWYASEDQVNDCLALLHPTRILTNRAELAVKAIHDLKPHFFSGYVRYQSMGRKLAMNGGEQTARE